MGLRAGKGGGPMNDQDEKMELRHEPVAGYRAAFYIVFAVSLLYMAIIFIKG
jgi:hypothetical protein